ncbi:MAG: hypothetical protein L3J79_07585, partial [Candidatus Marinimicrobia bacterium]|nr:hypothetical protein [Candidatus Neomarinimicrobiota bacterium]
MWRKMLQLGLVIPFALSLAFAANGDVIGEDHTAAVMEKNRIDMAQAASLLEIDASIRNSNVILDLRYDYIYPIGDLALPSGSLVEGVVTVADIGTVGTVTIDYDWVTDSYPGEGSFTVTSPTGTTLTIGAGDTDGHYTVALAGFSG